MQLTSLKSGRLALFGFFSALALGCVVSVGNGTAGGKDGECPEANSHIIGDECFCDIGYDWCDPDDPNDLTCCEEVTSNSSPTSNSNTDNSNSNTDSTTTDDPPTSGTTEEIPTTSQGTTTDVPTECVVETTPPDSCDEATENFLCLTATDAACGPEGSAYYRCEGGVWVQNFEDLDALCVSDGFDFSYGCEDDGTAVVPVCGTGPGTTCENGSPNVCNGETSIDFCVYGLLGTEDCLTKCQQVGDDEGVTYDYGYCGEQNGDIQCLCCDEGEDGCPLGGGTTTDSGGTDTDTGSSSG